MLRLESRYEYLQEQWLSLHADLERQESDLSFLLDPSNNDLATTTNNNEEEKLGPVLISGHAHLLSLISPLIRKQIREMRCQCRAIACPAKIPKVEMLLPDTKASTVHHLLALVYTGEVCLIRSELDELKALLAALGAGPDPNDFGGDQNVLYYNANNDNDYCGHNGFDNTGCSSESESDSKSFGEPAISGISRKKRKRHKRQYLDCKRCNSRIGRDRLLHVMSHIKHNLINVIQRMSGHQLMHLDRCFLCNKAFKEAKKTNDEELERCLHFVLDHGFGLSLMSDEERLLVTPGKNAAWNCKKELKCHPKKELQCHRCPKKVKDNRGFCMHVLNHLRPQLDQGLRAQGQPGVAELDHCHLCQKPFGKARSNSLTGRLIHLGVVHNLCDVFMTPPERAVFRRTRQRNDKVLSKRRFGEPQRNNEINADNNDLIGDETFSGSVLKGLEVRVERLSPEDLGSWQEETIKIEVDEIDLQDEDEEFALRLSE